jgi:hypothetical protein
MGNGDCFEDGQIDLNLDSAIPPQAIRNEDRGIDHRIGEPVLKGRGQMGNGFASASGIKGIGVGEERFPSIPFYLLDDPAQKEGTNKGGVSLLPEMKLDRYQVPLPDLRLQVCTVQQGIQFIKKALSGDYLQISEKDFILHALASLPKKINFSAICQ